MGVTHVCLLCVTPTCAQAASCVREASAFTGVLDWPSAFYEIHSLPVLHGESYKGLAPPWKTTKHGIPTINDRQLAAILVAATQQGLQRVVDAVHTHSLRWGWLLNVPQSVVMVFGKRSVCACLGAPELSWGACRLPTADTVKYLGLRLELEGGWAAQHLWLPVLCSQCLSAATKLLVLRSRIALCMTYGMKLWRPAKRGANMTVVLTRAKKPISAIHGETSQTALFKDRSVNQDVMLADLDILSPADHCRMAHARQHARQATSAAAAATCHSILNIRTE